MCYNYQIIIQALTLGNVNAVESCEHKKNSGKNILLTKKKKPIYIQTPFLNPTEMV